ncbi:phospholipase D-like domain-containing protein [Nitrospirillum sp. BR 11828]|uniref:phospholipase D-like domain-containing protein n=1 Tax=Nitrospirillum sp. BR 11828 TaxID=3104325 RepID=UPI002ACAF701|nr:phospholipase D-like domain-containing protein [Nitrospirillum sp. BR 11828]MDZ5650245.1 phospholipase D-like domain-containing protein [Nitrospirillum sp. BR 11828]
MPPRLSFVKTALIAFALAGSLAGCATLPSADPDIARALATADAAGRLDLLRRQGEIIGGAPFIGGNSITLLRSGTETYAAMDAALDGARTRIDMESYEFDGVEGSRFAEKLVAKRAQGVEVNLIYDAWGSQDTPDSVFTRLRQGGVNLLAFNPVDPTALLTLDVNRRDHRKLLIVDNAVAIVGGVNISAVYDRRHHAGPGEQSRGAENSDPEQRPWRDTDVRVAGPVVAEFESLYAQTWAQQRQAQGPDAAPALSAPPPTPRTRPGETVLQALSGAPTEGRPLIYRSLLVAVALARTSIHLTTGYFVPTPGLARALCQAARRGVDVTVLVPGPSDSPLSVMAGRGYYSDLLAAGVHIHEYADAILHAKTAVIDGDWSTVGSSNLDWRSVAFNNEINAVVLGAGFGREMEAMFQQDLTHAKAIDPEAWRHRGLDERLGEWGARLVEDVL